MKCLYNCFHSNWNRIKNTIRATRWDIILFLDAPPPHMHARARICVKRSYFSRRWSFIKWNYISFNFHFKTKFQSSLHRFNFLFTAFASSPITICVWIPTCCLFFPVAISAEMRRLLLIWCNGMWNRMHLWYEWEWINHQEMFMFMRLYVYVRMWLIENFRIWFAEHFFTYIYCFVRAKNSSRQFTIERVALMKHTSFIAIIAVHSNTHTHTQKVTMMKTKTQNRSALVLLLSPIMFLMCFCVCVSMIC